MRDFEELLFERGVIVTYETIRCWCDNFGEDFARRVKAARQKPGSTCHFDERFVTLWRTYLLWRAVDEHGAELDVLLQKRRNKAAAGRFFKRALHSSTVPRKIVPEQLRSYPAANTEIPALANVKHVFVKAAPRLKNRSENSHQPTRERERRMRGYRDPKRTQKFLSYFRSDPATFLAQAAGICYALHFIAHNLEPDSLHGVNSPNSPKIRRLLSDGSRIRRPATSLSAS